jgi:hypothetical protein
MVKRYGTGMQSGGSPISSTGNSNSTVNNNNQRGFLKKIL